MNQMASAHQLIHNQCTKERPACAPCLQLSQRCHYSRKVSRTPLTRANLTATEERVRDLETALASLFPGIDLETVLSSAAVGPSGQASKESEAPSPEKPLSPPADVKQEFRDRHGSSSPAPESLPLAADGFDWSENAVNLGELADGMAALSINPEGAGYLGKPLWSSVYHGC